MHRVQGNVGEAPRGLGMVHRSVCCSRRIHRGVQGCEGGVVRVREVEQWCKGMHEWHHADQGGCMGCEGVRKIYYRGLERCMGMCKRPPGGNI